MAEYRKEMEWEIKREVKDFSDYEVGMSHPPKVVDMVFKVKFEYPVTYMEASSWVSEIMNGKKRW